MITRDEERPVTLLFDPSVGTELMFNSTYGYRALPPGPRTILFLSQPFEVHPDTNPMDGYNEKRVLDHVIYAVESISTNMDEPWTILVWLPPDQAIREFDYLTWWSGKTKIVKTKDNLDTLWQAADLVVGMTSPLLGTSLLNMRPTIACVPRLKGPLETSIPNHEVVLACLPVFRIIDLHQAVEDVMYATKVRRVLYHAALKYKEVVNKLSFEV